MELINTMSVLCHLSLKWWHRINTQFKNIKFAFWLKLLALMDSLSNERTQERLARCHTMILRPFNHISFFVLNGVV